MGPKVEGGFFSFLLFCALQCFPFLKYFAYEGISWI